MERDIVVGAKKSAVVPLRVPAFADESVDLELTWTISVRHATCGFSLTFIPIIGGAGGESSNSNHPDFGNNDCMMINDSGDESDAQTNDESDDRSTASKRGPRTMMRNLLRRGQSREANKPPGDQEEEISSPLNGMSLSTNVDAVSIKDHDRVCRGEVMSGSFRLGNRAGRIVFSLDNSFSKARRKRVYVKLVVQTFSQEAVEKEKEVEMLNIQKLRRAVLSKVPDPSGYLNSDLTVKRFKDARPGE
jgi:hypothetical protein